MVKLFIIGFKLSIYCSRTNSSHAFCKHIAKATQAHPQGKALSKSLQSRPQKEIHFFLPTLRCFNFITNACNSLASLASIQESSAELPSPPLAPLANRQFQLYLWPMVKLIPIVAGYFKLDGGAMFGVVPKSIWNKLNPADDQNLCLWAMRCLLVDTGDKRILIDNGMGDKQSDKFFSYYHPSGPSIKESLAEAGYRPEDITDVFMTHLHFDHCGGGVEKNAEGGFQLTFPNALYWSNQMHWEGALHPNPREKASFLKENIEPIQQSGRLRFIDGPGPWFPGIRVVFVHGHTDAQMLPVIRMDDGRELWFLADLVASSYHLKAAYVMGYDMRPLETMEEKQSILQSIAKENGVAFFEHDPHLACAAIQDLGNGNFTLGETYTLA